MTVKWIYERIRSLDMDQSQNKEIQNASKEEFFGCHIPSLKYELETEFDQEYYDQLMSNPSLVEYLKEHSEEK
jgi:hypothetical protein